MTKPDDGIPSRDYCVSGSIEVNDRAEALAERAASMLAKGIIGGTGRPNQRTIRNYIKEHLGLPARKTPAELAGIKVQGDNKWLTLIQNASKAKETRSSQLTKVDSDNFSSELTET